MQVRIARCSRRRKPQGITARLFVDENSTKELFRLSALREHWFFAVVPYFSNPQLNPRNALSCTTCGAFGSPRVFVSCYKICSRSALTAQAAGSTSSIEWLKPHIRPALQH